MRKFVVAVLGAVLLSAQAAPSPVIAHYRAYNAAIQAGDMDGAEREADAALQASIAQDGNGGRTGVLALNLAKLRIVRIRPGDAYEPAKLAFDIASRNGDAGINPVLARLVLGQAELTPAHESEGHDRLLAALPDAASHPELQQDAYQGAVALGHWMLMRQNYADAAVAWDFAARYAPSLPGDHHVPLAEARINQGAALINRASETNDRYHDYEHAGAVLTEPLRVLAPLANVVGESDEITVSQEQYARARGWFGVINARLRSLGKLVVENPESAPEWYEACRVHMQWPHIEYPEHARDEGSIGVVILRQIMRNGRASGARIAAAVPLGSGFEQTLAPGLSQWTADVRGDDPDCLEPKVIWRNIVFRF